MTRAGDDAERSDEEERRLTPEEAFDAAMRYENRANPYPFFDELRKTPVVRVTNGIYAVTGYDELIALAHDPRVSSDRRKSHAPSAGDRPDVDESVLAMMEAYDRDPSFIAPIRRIMTGRAGSACGFSARRIRRTSSPARSRCVSESSTTCSIKRLEQEPHGRCR